MRLLAFLLIAASLLFGSLAAMTAYLPRTSLDDERFRAAPPEDAPADAAPAYLLTARPVGHPGKPALLPAGAPLSPDNLQILRKEGVARVKVKEFSFGRWSEKWLFAVSVAGLIGGAMINRRETRRDLARAAALAETGDVVPPDTLLRELNTALAALRKQVQEAPETRQRQRLLIDTIGGLDKTHVQPFVEARAVIVGRLGLSGYASLMDAFASAERNLNRSWSAAADGHLEESLFSLDAAAEGFTEAMDRFR